MAVTQTKYYEFSAADACQLSVPTTDTKVRLRANGYRNEGTSNQFVILRHGRLREEHRAAHGAAVHLGWTARAFHVPPRHRAGRQRQRVDLFHQDRGHRRQRISFATWGAEDFGSGTDGDPIDQGLNLSVTCTLPPNVACRIESGWDIDVGN